MIRQGMHIKVFESRPSLDQLLEAEQLMRDLDAKGSEGTFPRVLKEETHVLEERIDGGSYGEVWKARSVHTGNQIAVKFLKPEHLGTYTTAQSRRVKGMIQADALKTFLTTETSIAHLVRHPNVLQGVGSGSVIVDYVGHAISVPFIASELAFTTVDRITNLDSLRGTKEGQMIQQSLMKKDYRWVADVLFQMGRAIEHVRYRGLIDTHGDLRGPNILFMDGDLDHVVLADYGFTPQLEEEVPEGSTSPSARTLDGTKTQGISRRVHGVINKDVRAGKIPPDLVTEIHSFGFWLWNLLEVIPEFSDSASEARVSAMELLANTCWPTRNRTHKLFSGSKEGYDENPLSVFLDRLADASGIPYIHNDPRYYWAQDIPNGCMGYALLLTALKTDGSRHNIRAEQILNEVKVYTRKIMKDLDVGDDVWKALSPTASQHELADRDKMMVPYLNEGMAVMSHALEEVLTLHVDGMMRDLEMVKKWTERREHFIEDIPTAGNTKLRSFYTRVKAEKQAAQRRADDLQQCLALTNDPRFKVSGFHTRYLDVTKLNKEILDYVNVLDGILHNADSFQDIQDVLQRLTAEREAAVRKEQDARARAGELTQRMNALESAKDAAAQQARAYQQQGVKLKEQLDEANLRLQGTVSGKVIRYASVLLPAAALVAALIWGVGEYNGRREVQATLDGRNARVAELEATNEDLDGRIDAWKVANDRLRKGAGQADAACPVKTDCPPVERGAGFMNSADCDLSITVDSDGHRHYKVVGCTNWRNGLEGLRIEGPLKVEQVAFNDRKVAGADILFGYYDKQGRFRLAREPVHVRSVKGMGSFNGSYKNMTWYQLDHVDDVERQAARAKTPRRQTKELSDLYR